MVHRLDQLRGRELWTCNSGDVTLNLFRPSSATRWLNCPGSHFLAVEDSPSNVYAIEGTAAHALLEKMLLAGQWELVGHSPIPVTCDVTGEVTMVEVGKKMVNSINFALSYIKGLTDKLVEPKLLTETRLEHPVIEGLGGTLDVIIQSGETLIIADYKNGTSSVKADSDQLSTYAVLARLNYEDATHIETHVIQPNRRTKRKTVMYEWTANELDAYDQTLYNGTMAANLVTLDNINENLKTGSYCWFCPARSTCTAKSAEQAAKDFTNLNESD